MKPLVLTSVSPMLLSKIAPPKAVEDMFRMELVEFHVPCEDATRFHSDVHARLFAAVGRGGREGLFDGLMWSDVVRIWLR